MLRWILLLSIAQLAWGYHDPNCNGKQVIVHLFEWKWTDIAQECERYLAGAGYCGVQVSPPNEHVVLPGDNYPWWQRYQPVSYKLYSRSGTEEQFADMVKRCNKVGVRVYVDVVVNHMAGLGRIGTGDGGSSYNSDNFDFPGVPYTAEHFTPRSLCPSGDGNVNNYGDPNNVRNCFLVGLTDLYGKLDHVRDAVAGYFSHLVDLGVAGIRIDAAKHMWPEDIASMLAKTKTLSTEHGFAEGSTLFVYQEVIDRNDGAVRVQEYFDTGYTTEFRFTQKLATGVQNYGELGNLVDYGWGMAQSDRAFVFLDNHDNQRGHAGGSEVITHKTPHEYKQGVAYMLAQDYGFTRVMSSYYFDSDDQGPPHNGDFTTADVPINADGTCGGGWVCEHRWNSIAKMVKFRNAAAGKPIANYFNNGGAVAFSRGNVGFFAMAKDGKIDQSLQTGLPAGKYCNLIDSCKTSLEVGSDGMAHVHLDNYEDPVLAVCVGCDSDSPTPPPVDPTTQGPTTKGPTHGPTTKGTTQTPMPGSHRTVIFIKKQTMPGQDLFIRGGFDQTIRPECATDSSSCAISIKVNSLGESQAYAKYNAWREGDNSLDWNGAEKSQGSYMNQPAQGTPLAWTTNSPSSPSYQSLNTWGDHYWMVDLDMDCSQTEQGWFEFKTLILNGWENDISQMECTGESNGKAPFVSKNHAARCGYINKFDYGSGSCQINSF